MMQSNSDLWIDYACLPVHLTIHPYVHLLSTFLPFAFKFRHLHCNPTIPSLVVTWLIHDLLLNVEEIVVCVNDEYTLKYI